jgi:hypothetical protein
MSALDLDRAQHGGDRASARASKRSIFASSCSKECRVTDQAMFDHPSAGAQLALGQGLESVHVGENESRRWNAPIMPFPSG